jgi:hypothetical protein
MGMYKDVKTGAVVEIPDDKDFHFPASGAKILLKSRPPIAKEHGTD